MWFQIAARYAERFRVRNAEGDWVPLGDGSAPVGTLRPQEPASPVGANTRMTTLVIDEDKYSAAQAVLGTTTLRETVDRAFSEVLARAARAQDIERLRRMEGLDLDKPAVMRDAWR